MEAFNENWYGPVIEFFAALPNSPAAGAANAAGLKNQPGGAALEDSPV